MGEFDLIARYFKARARPTAAVRLGVGDDCALLAPDAGQELAISTDLLLEGRHFLAATDPEALGHKALAVNLSDLAAMGATPLAFTLALALPPARAQDDAWMQAFSRGLLALADRHACPLVGGDTTAGPLAIGITVLGQVPRGQALRRSGARDGDDIWVSGTLGDARLALGALRDEWTLSPALMALARERLERPSPRLPLGQALRGLAHSAMDISDGLLGDLGHLLAASGVGACLDAEAVAGTALASTRAAAVPRPRLLAATLAGGDDYELLFTAPEARRAAIVQAGRRSNTPLTRIGQIEAGRAIRLLAADGRRLDATRYQGFDHFR